MANVSNHYPSLSRDPSSFNSNGELNSPASLSTRDLIERITILAKVIITHTETLARSSTIERSPSPPPQHAQQQLSTPKQQPLPSGCRSMIFFGECSKGFHCRFSHDDRVLRESAQFMSDALHRSPYSEVKPGSDVSVPVSSQCDYHENSCLPCSNSHTEQLPEPSVPVPEAPEASVPVLEQQIEVIVQNDVVISDVIERPCQVEHLAAPVLSLPESTSAADVGVPVWFASLAVISRLLPLLFSCSSFLPAFNQPKSLLFAIRVIGTVIIILNLRGNSLNLRENSSKISFHRLLTLFSFLQLCYCFLLFILSS